MNQKVSLTLFDLVFQQIALAVATLAVVSAAPASSSGSSSTNVGLGLINIQCSGDTTAVATQNFQNSVSANGNNVDCESEPYIWSFESKVFANQVCKLAAGTDNTQINYGQQSADASCINIPIYL